jgi:alpha-D-xyloside xylohydrolase
MKIKAGKILSFGQRGETEVLFQTETGCISLSFFSDFSLSFSFYREKRFENLAIGAKPIPLESITIRETEHEILLKRGDVQVALDKMDGSFTVSYFSMQLKVLDYELLPKTIHSTQVYEANAIVSAEIGESFYGLGQQQTHTLDYANQRIEVFHNYKGEGGERIGIPFLVSSRNYGIIWNTLSQSVFEPGKNGKSHFHSDAAKDVSLFLLLGKNYNDIYYQYRLLTGITPIPLKSTLGYIQCKQRYKNQDEVLAVGHRYREKKYPLDMLVVDWFYWKILGDMDLNPEDWPDSQAMNAELKGMGIDTMISVWPRFMKDSRYYDKLEAEGWFVKDKDGRTVYGTEDDRRGALIDTTNEEASSWYWNTIRENLASKGFNAWWCDEDEPDLWPYEYYFAAGPGFEQFNLYPYTHCKAIYTGHRSSQKERCSILSRSAYLGAQQFGTQFWSSDIYPTWDALRRQIPAAINFCATGFAWWSSDIGGWQALPDYQDENSDNSLLLDTKNSGLGIVNSQTFPELYIRWFQFSVFCPVFRAHGTRAENEVWSYGAKAEVILVRYLRLRYQLMPYLYSQAYQVYATGAPVLKGMFMEFDDLNVRDIKDQFLFGPSLLIAPILEEGKQKRMVYLPKGCQWYDFWTEECFDGGQPIEVTAPLDSIPVFVRSGSILPLGKAVQSTKEKQRDIELRVYRGSDCTFALYGDDGRTYAYENGEYELNEIRWSEKEGRLQLPKSNTYSFTFRCIGVGK